jgi:transcriptional regulator with XRE-family HTH domain
MSNGNNNNGNGENLRIFGERLKQAREAKGYTQEDIARVIHKDRFAVSRYESGKHEPGATIACKLARYLGVSSDWLVGDSAEMVPTSQLDRDIASLNSEDREAVLKLIKALKKK